MKTALVHDYLKESGGAERVLVALSEIYKQAPIYTSFYDPNSMAYRRFGKKSVYETKWGKILKYGKLYSYFRFLLPFVWKSLDLSSYDLVITSCSGYIARGFKVSSKTKIVAYCHTPPRWLYGYETPTGANRSWWGKLYLWLVGPFLRYFDYQSAQRVDLFIANSKEVASRIKKFYRKDAVVVYPPCAISKINNQVIDEEYWLIVSRIVGGKGIEAAIELAKKTKQKLCIVGTGPLKDKLERHSATVSQISWKGYVVDSEMEEIYARAKGFLALSKDEDFGMSVVEAMAHGIPVLAYDGGGYRETVIDGVNGKLVNSNQEAVMSRVMKEWDHNNWDKEKIKKSVAKFGRERFVREIKKVVERARKD